MSYANLKSDALTHTQTHDYGSSHQRCSIKKVVLKNFAKTPAQVFSCEFCEISKNTFFTEHLWATASTNTHKHSKTHAQTHILIKSNRSLKVPF